MHGEHLPRDDRHGRDHVVLGQRDNLVSAGTVLAAKDPIVRRCRDFFTEATLMPTLDPDAIRAAERHL